MDRFLQIRARPNPGVSSHYDACVVFSAERGRVKFGQQLLERALRWHSIEVLCDPANVSMSTSPPNGRLYPARRESRKTPRHRCVTPFASSR